LAAANGRVTGALALAGAVACVLCAVALGAPATGKYAATGAIQFHFSIAKGRCPSPPDPTNPSASHGPVKRGLCFHSADEPQVAMTCPPPASISGEPALISSFDGLRLSSAGAMDSRAWAFTDSGPVGYTELSIKVKGRKASGWVQVSDQVGDSDTGPITCDSGQLQFTAKRR
jgi:hypothetical protein